MYGMIVKVTAKPGKRDDLIALMLDVTEMPGCLSYVVAADATEPDALWITEAWASKEQHSASLSLPAVQATIKKAMPLIAGMSAIATTTPVGGHGLVTAAG